MDVAKLAAYLLGSMRQERLLRSNPRPIALDDARLLYEAAL